MVSLGFRFCLFWFNVKRDAGEVWNQEILEISFSSLGKHPPRLESFQRREELLWSLLSTRWAGRLKDSNVRNTRVTSEKLVTETCNSEWRRTRYLTFCLLILKSIKLTVTTMSHLHCWQSKEKEQRKNVHEWGQCVSVLATSLGRCGCVEWCSPGVTTFYVLFCSII